MRIHFPKKRLRDSPNAAHIASIAGMQLGKRLRLRGITIQVRPVSNRSVARETPDVYGERRAIPASPAGTMRLTTTS